MSALVNRSCARCEAATSSVVELARDGATIAEIIVCRSCQDKLNSQFDGHRRTFETLLAEGMSRDLANRVMIAWYI